MSNISAPAHFRQCKPARSFEVGDVVHMARTKLELQAKVKPPRAYRRYMIVKALGMGRYGYEFWVRDLDSAELKKQGFGSQQMFVVEGEQS